MAPFSVQFGRRKWQNLFNELCDVRRASGVRLRTPPRLSNYGVSWIGKRHSQLRERGGNRWFLPRACGAGALWMIARRRRVKDCAFAAGRANGFSLAVSSCETVCRRPEGVDANRWVANKGCYRGRDSPRLSRGSVGISVCQRADHGRLISAHREFKAIEVSKSVQGEFAVCLFSSSAILLAHSRH